MKAVRKHYAALRESYVLTTGRFKQPPNRVRGNLTWSEARKNLEGFTAFLLANIDSGSKALADFAHRVRGGALTGRRIPERVVSKRFLASTISRSVDWGAPSPETLSTKIEEARARWAEKRAVDRSLYAAIERYINVLPIGHPADGDMSAPRAPLPSGNSCMSHSRRAGGTAKALRDRRWDRAKERALGGVQQYDIRTSSEVVAGLHPRDGQAGVEGRSAVQEMIQFGKEGRSEPLPIPDQDQIELAFLYSVRPALRPLAIPEMGAKVRVATLHPAEEVQTARRITGVWLRALRKCIVTRDMLEGKQVHLTGSRSSEIYSADLKAATDYIDHDLAQHVGRLLCKRIGQGEFDTAVVSRLLGSHLDGDIPTMSGIHMGLGPTWIVLSILNSFAAWHAGARKESYAVCGDDLTGFWSRRTVSRYESTLEALGLVVNKSKSFYGPHGVFCERLVKQTGPISAVTYDVGHLSALTGAKCLAGRSSSKLAVANDPCLLDSRYTDIGQRTMRQFVPRGTGPGKVSHYGNGRGPLEWGGLLALARGNSGLDEGGPPIPKGLGAELKAAAGSEESHITNVDLDDFAIAFRTGLRQRDLMKGNPPKPPKPVSTDEFRKRGRKNRSPKGPRLTAVMAKIVLATQSSSLRSKDKQLVKKILKTNRTFSGPRSSTSTRRRLENILSRPRAARYLKRETAISLLQVWTGVDGERLLQEKSPRERKAGRQTRSSGVR